MYRLIGLTKKTMTPKEKAKELVDKFFNTQSKSYCSWGQAKQCALIAVEELLNDTDATSPFEIDRLNYWQEVKTEINEL